jgi:hypothetical protein
MVKKIHITREQTAVITCPMCQISKTTDVSKVIKLEKMAKFNVRCRCGHIFTALLERRKHYRKETNLTGSYVRLVSGKPLGRGHMTVRDLSLTGMRLEVHGPHDFSEGDIMEIEFRLDDMKKTLIKRKVVVRNVKNYYLGIEFFQTEKEDKALGFYLMP